MKLLIDAFIRTLKERNELDVLLPDLLIEMGLSLISKPQRGTRQNGVDLAAVGPDEIDGVRKIFLFVIKQGDIGRNEWDVGKNAVRPTLNEVFDAYIPGYIANEHKGLPIKVVVCTSGERKEEISANWAGYTTAHSQAEMVFWGASHLAGLIEKNLLSENIFNSEDRRDLRKLLSLLGDADYKYRDLHRLLVRQLGLAADGSETTTSQSAQQIEKALLRVNLIARMAIGWDESEKNTKNNLIAAEHALLWSFRRVSLEPPARRRQLKKALSGIWQTYSAAAVQYLDKIEGHAKLSNGLAGYCGESSLFAVTTYELIGLVASIGLAHVYQDDDKPEVNIELAHKSAKILASIIENNSIAGSPPFDRNVVEICLALSLLVITRKSEVANGWLDNLVKRFHFSHLQGRRFPISSDSIEDLAEFAFDYKDEKRKSKLLGPSWMLATLYGWCVVLNASDAYSLLYSAREKLKTLTPQLWHPTADVHDHLYVSTAYYHSGISDAPMEFPAELEAHRENIEKLLAYPNLDVLEGSFGAEIGYLGVDFIACRHHRCPVPPVFWYRLRGLWPDSKNLTFKLGWRWGEVPPNWRTWVAERQTPVSPRITLLS